MMSSEMNNPMTQQRQVWDPFDGKKQFDQQVVEASGEGIEFPQPAKKFAALATLAGGAGLLYGFVNDQYLWPSVALFSLSMVAQFAIDILSKRQKKIDHLLFKVAQHNDWAFHLTPSTDEQAHPLVLAAAQVVPELMSPQLRDPTPFVFQAIYAGKTKQKEHFWTGISFLRFDATLGNAAKQNDVTGAKSNQGVNFQLLCAYPLNRNLGFRAALSHEGIRSSNLRDLQTESVQFNEAFKIQLTDDPAPFDTAEVELLRALTPATQDRLLQLKERYHVRLVLDDDTVFLAGTDRINSDDEQITAERLETIIDEFAQAARSFQTYIE